MPWVSPMLHGRPVSVVVPSLVPDEPLVSVVLAVTGPVLPVLVSGLMLPVVGSPVLVPSESLTVPLGSVGEVLVSLTEVVGVVVVGVVVVSEGVPVLLALADADSLVVPLSPQPASAAHTRRPRIGSREEGRVVPIAR